MRGIPESFLLIFFASVFIVEVISFLGVWRLVADYPSLLKKRIKFGYLIISIFVFILLLYSFSAPGSLREYSNYNFLFLVITITFLNLIPKLFFAIATLLSYLVHFIFNQKCQLLVLTGSVLLCLGINSTMLYGLLFGRYNIRVEQHDLYLHNLPSQLNGIKVVQLSDIHLGSFQKNFQTLHKTIELLNEIQPDILLFTGDIVNNFSDELEGSSQYLKKLPAKFGKYAITGNHDYGDYSNWPDSISKKLNLAQIQLGLTNAGFHLLLNQWEKLQINDTSIYLIGVENWGHRPFPQYARLDDALKGIPKGGFQILLTHDPAHWEAKVRNKTDIPLTLAGHTHGGQFAIKLAGIEFSPLYFYQKLWGGLYQEKNQYLYVNKGLGTIGFPGRIEMRPEITVLTLYRTKNH